MNFLLSRAYFNMILMYTPESLEHVASSLVLKKQEFIELCQKGHCEEADKIIEQNILHLTNSVNIYFALEKIVNKFPKLNIDLPDTTLCNALIQNIGKHTEEMLAIAKEQRRHGK